MRVLLINPWNPETFPPPSIGYLQSGAPFYEYEHPLRELKQWADMINAA